MIAGAWLDSIAWFWSDVEAYGNLLKPESKQLSPFQNSNLNGC